jgi:peptide/nickel transport system permease protein
MVKILLRRLLGAIPVLLALGLVVFILREIAPVDEVATLVGENAPPEAVAQAREELGLNDPMLVQYVRYLGNTARGDLGESTLTRRSIRKEITNAFPATAELVLVTFAMIVVLGVLLGMATAQGWRGAGVFRTVMIWTGSIPTFLLAIFVMLFFYRRLGWLPATGRSSIRDAPEGPTRLLMVDGVLHGRLDVVWDTFRHLLMPAMCLAIRPAVAVGRVLRSSLLHTLRSDHIRTARVKGLSEKRILVRHALRNSSGPVLALWGLELAALFGGAVVIEKIFAYPGLGLLSAQSIERGDFNVIAGVTIVAGVLYVVANTLVDLVQAWADPRVRF